MTHARRLKQRWNRLCILLAGAVGLCAQSEAQASSAIFGPDAFSALLDMRLVAADGERSWTDGGFGKTRFGGSEDGDWKLRPAAAEATLVWQPRFSWDLNGTVVLSAQHEQDNPVDLVEAFLTWKPAPRSALRFSGRAGLYWPAISLEHEGAAWSVSDMITPSAINSWIGEEVKVLGAEATLSGEAAGNRLSGTFGLFGFNDTAGTLLSFRGWALHDLKATAFGHQQLPPLNDFMLGAQAPRTKPLIELDDRVGYYARLSWAFQAPVLIEAFYYNTRGDPEAVNADLQWGWETRFWNLGARVDFSDRTRLYAQALTGVTEMGFENEAGRYWVETRYRSAFARLSHDAGPLTLSGRAELFDTREQGCKMSSGESEEGWALTAAAAWEISPEATLLVEALHIDSERGVRSRLGIDSGQKQNLVQASVRIRL